MCSKFAFRIVITLVAWVVMLLTLADFIAETCLVFASPTGTACLNNLGCPYWQIPGIAGVSFGFSLASMAVLLALFLLLLLPQCTSGVCSEYFGWSCNHAVRGVVSVIWFVAAVVGFASLFIIRDDFATTAYLNRVLYFISVVFWEIRNFVLIVTVAALNSFRLPDQWGPHGTLSGWTKSIPAALALTIIFDLGTFIVFLVEIFLFAENAPWSLALALSLIVFLINIIWRLILFQSASHRICNSERDYFYPVSNDAKNDVTTIANSKFEWMYE